MYLPLRLAASVPVMIAVVIGLAMGLFMASGEKLPAWIKYQQIGGLTLMAGAAGLLLVLPNVAGAFAANRFAGKASVAAFSAAFIAVFVASWLLQVRFLDRGLRTIGGFPAKLTEPKLLACLAVNVAICLAVAAWFGRPPESHG